MNHEGRGWHRWITFSIRKLLFVVMLLCVYLASWRATVTHGVPDAKGTLLTSERVVAIGDSVPLPFVVGLDESFTSRATPTGVLLEDTDRRYYFWFFGYIARLPFERTVRHLKN